MNREAKKSNLLRGSSQDCNFAAFHLKRECQVMSIIGTVESVWRYPVKGMRAEEMDEFFAGYTA